MSEKLPVTSPSLDARTLLSRSMDDFHAKEYPIEGDFQVLWGIIDTYIDGLETIAGSVTDEGHLGKHSPRFRENRKKLYRSIMAMFGSDIDRIKTVRIDSNGMLFLRKKNGVIQTKNLIESWNSFLLEKPSGAPIVSNTKVQKIELKEAINTESYLGGSVIVQYAPYIPGTIAIGTMGHSAYSFVRDTLSLGKDAVEFVVKSISVRDGNGKLRVVPLTEIYKGSKKAISENLFRILEKAGYVFETSTRSFFHPAERAFSETGWKIQALKYADWKRQNPGNSLTETEFQKTRTEMLEKMKIFSQSMEGKIDTTFLEKVGKFSKSFANHAGELFFLPIFFREFRKHQNTATLLIGVTEMALFTSGTRIANTLLATRVGARLPIPGWGRLIVTLLAGGAAIVGGAELMKALDENRNKWRHLYVDGFGSLYTDGKSTTGHFGSGLGITEGLDLLNRAGRKIAPNEDDWDIGIPRIEIPLWNGKYLGTLPDITFFQAKINFGTAPWDWICGAKGRTIDDWNTYVEYYQVRLKKEIFDLVDKYRKDKSMFSDPKKIKEAGGKDSLFKEHLEDILVGSEGGNAFFSEKQALIDGIVAEIKRTPFEPSVSEGIIDNRLNQMKIDNLFIENRTLEIQRKKEKIDTSISFLGPYVSEKTLMYIYSIPQRMIENQSIVNNNGGKWEKYKAPLTGEILKKWIPSTENNYFQGLLDDNRTIQIDTGNRNIPIKLGEYFAWILDQMLEYKRESEFIREIKNGNKQGIKWGI